MTKQINITEQEKRILQNIHLTGTMGKCGNMTKDKRLSILLGLMTKGLLRENMTLTSIGIDVSLPSAPLTFFTLIQ
jgi:hypothetical protein